MPFYRRETREVARDLIGCLLRHETPETPEGTEGTAAGIIVETEAYLGQADEASHARFGRTGRSRIMFGPPGRAYVYFIYGMHYMFNVVTEPAGTAGAVLIRALKPTEGLELMARRRGGAAVGLPACGPARLTRALGISLEQNGDDLTAGPLGIWDRKPGSDIEINATPRIGVVGSREHPWRFVMKGNPHVSK